MGTPGGRATLAAAALILLVLGGDRFGRRADAGHFTLNECLELAPACLGRRLDASFLKIAGQTAGVLEVHHGPRRFRLLGVDATGTRPDIDEISIIATWQGGGDLLVHEAILHPHQRLKKLAGVFGVLGWLLYLGRSRPRG